MVSAIQPNHLHHMINVKFQEREYNLPLENLVSVSYFKDILEYYDTKSCSDITLNFDFDIKEVDLYFKFRSLIDQISKELLTLFNQELFNIYEYKRLIKDPNIEQSLQNLNHTLNALEVAQYFCDDLYEKIYYLVKIPVYKFTYNFLSDKKIKLIETYFTQPNIFSFYITLYLGIYGNYFYEWSNKLPQHYNKKTINSTLERYYPLMNINQKLRLLKYMYQAFTKHNCFEYGIYFYYIKLFAEVWLEKRIVITRELFNYFVKCLTFHFPPSRSEKHFVIREVTFVSKDKDEMDTILSIYIYHEKLKNIKTSILTACWEIIDKIVHELKENKLWTLFK